MRLITTVSLMALMAACQPASKTATTPTGLIAGSSERNAAEGHTEMDRAAQEFVRLALAFGAHDDNYVDAYTGDASFAQAIKDSPLSKTQIAEQAKV